MQCVWALCRKFYAGNPLHPISFAARQKRENTLRRIVICQAQYGNSFLTRQRHQLLNRRGSIGMQTMQVQVNPNHSTFRHTPLCGYISSSSSSLISNKAARSNRTIKRPSSILELYRTYKRAAIELYSFVNIFTIYKNL